MSKMLERLAVPFLFSSFVLWGQTPGLPRDPSLGYSELDRRVQQQIFEKWALAPNAEKDTIARRQAELELSQFYEKARHFVQSWDAFASELKDKKTFNAKLAKQVSKAFHDLEKSDGWPIGRHK